MKLFVGIADLGVTAGDLFTGKCLRWLQLLLLLEMTPTAHATVR
ncbi:hypothetical protein [Tolypothrix sp. NIES-4075]|nr:hypothetical protein [Tolypothrix sp. NIES-4075]